ncbi:MAG TPA: hypothetical protein PKC43_09795 [Phycisphaerales bacterium]|nr:hypothetical protein [Phycisphaerales bacterium]HMP37726.1 hypothetical protein [Phycisphaerales bacterium]
MTQQEPTRPSPAPRPGDSGAERASEARRSPTEPADSSGSASLGDPADPTGPSRCIHLTTGRDGESHVAVIPLPLRVPAAATAVEFAESPPGASLDWHPAPCLQYVITLSGTLEFVTRGGERFLLRPGDVLLAADTTGGGHRWRLIDDQPWRRVYVRLAT